MKVCRACKEEKDVVEFSKDRSRSDGLLTICKGCDKEKNKKWLSNNRHKTREWRRNNPDNLKNWHKKNKGKSAEYGRTQKKKHPEHVKARRLLAEAVRTGKLIVLPCEVCFNTHDIEAHHDDYSKPLEVRWLCRKHHLEVHGKVAYKTVEAVEVCRGICELCCIKGCCDER